MITFDPIRQNSDDLSLDRGCSTTSMPNTSMIMTPSTSALAMIATGQSLWSWIS